MRTIAVRVPLAEVELARVRAAAPGWRVVPRDDPSQGPALWGEAEVLVGWDEEAGEAGLAEGAALRWVHDWSAGVDRLPLELLRARGVVLTNASGVHAFPIAETAFGLVLSFVRGLDGFGRSQAQGEWRPRWDLGEIHGKTLGVLGVGAIGTEVARLGRAFGMAVLGFRRTAEPAPGFDRTFGGGGLEAMLAVCDVVVNALPLTPRTRHLVGEAQLRAMKPTAFYVNVGRGATTDERALAAALAEKRIAGAGLDVFEVEPLPADSPLWRLGNVLITPHCAGSNPDYDRRATDILVDGLRDWTEGRIPTRNRVDLAEGY